MGHGTIHIVFTDANRRSSTEQCSEYAKFSIFFHNASTEPELNRVGQELMAQLVV